MKFSVFVHLLSQIVGQAAVAAIVPLGYEKYFAALVAIIGVLAAYYDIAHAEKVSGG